VLIDLTRGVSSCYGEKKGTWILGRCINEKRKYGGSRFPMVWDVVYGITRRQKTNF